MRGDLNASAPEPQGLTRSRTQTSVAHARHDPMASKSMELNMACKVMKFKLRSNVKEVSEMRQVEDMKEMLGDMTKMLGEKNVGMKENL